MKVFVVNMLRWGDNNNHSYMVAVCSSKELAVIKGKKEEEQRDGKYEYEIKEFELLEDEK